MTLEVGSPALDHPSISVGVRRLDHGADLPLPEAASLFAAGVDLRAALSATIILAPGERALVPTGLVIELPSGYEAQVRPRSGLALRQGVTVANAPGTIDSDYRGEVGVILVNLGQKPVTLERGDRIAQLVVAPVVRVDWVESASISESLRGSGGFGSTGRK